MSITPIGGQVTAPAVQVANNSGSGKFWDYLALGTAAVGPAVTESMLYAGNTRAATISAAATNATFGGASIAAGGTPSYMMNPYMNPTAVPGGSPSYQMTPTGAGSDTGNLQQMIADSAASQSQFIILQKQIGDQANQYTAMSNILQTKQQGERSAIQNFRN